MRMYGRHVSLAYFVFSPLWNRSALPSERNRIEIMKHRDFDGTETTLNSKQ